MARATRAEKVIPSGPFAKWLNDRVDFYTRNQRFPWLKDEQVAALKRVCDEIGWVNPQARDSYDAGLRRLYRYRRAISETNRGTVGRRRGPRVVVPLDVFDRCVVEDALHHAGVFLEGVYPRDRFPALYEDIPLEPEMFCANCQDTCSPIRGECPWCNGTLLVRAA